MSNQLTVVERGTQTKHLLLFVVGTALLVTQMVSSCSNQVLNHEGDQTKSRRATKISAEDLPFFKPPRMTRLVDLLPATTDHLGRRLRFFEVASLC